MAGTAQKDEAALIPHGTHGVLDASALLAFVYEEKGADRVDAVIRGGAVISRVNWAEALSRMTELGLRLEEAVHHLNRQVGEVGTLSIMPLEQPHALEAARLRLITRHLGLSLADRICLAVARLHRLPVLTTDRAWRSLRISVKIEVIR